MRDYLSTREVADYLRIKERTIYELVRTGQIPCSRVTGKLLFPRRLIDLWVLQRVDGAAGLSADRPAVVAGSHDPLLDWAVRRSGCELALLIEGSEDGVARLTADKAMVAGLHIIDPATGDYNVPALRATSSLADLVLIEWAKREQGLVVAPGNPLGISAIRDLARRGVRLVQRQPGAGAQILLRHLLAKAALDPAALSVIAPPALTENDIATTILDGKAEAGLAIRAVAHRFRLGFVPLLWERFDLAMRRRDYFEPPLQKLLGFARSAAFAEKAAELTGYDVAATGTVIYNA